MIQNIICLKWGVKYTSEYVNRLFAGIKKFTNTDIKLHCFTDDYRGLNPNIYTYPIPHPGLSGWWNKVSFFSNALPFDPGTPLLYLDLDTVITGDFEPILELNDPRSMFILRDFYTGIAKSITSDSFVGSAVMSWQHGDFQEIWLDFEKHPRMAVDSVFPHGDQRWIQKYLNDSNRKFYQDVIPGQLVSFKAHCQYGLPTDTRVVCFHGKPSIEEAISNTNQVLGHLVPPATWLIPFWGDI